MKTPITGTDLLKVGFKQNEILSLALKLANEKYAKLYLFDLAGYAGAIKKNNKCRRKELFRLVDESGSNPESKTNT